MSGGVEVAAAAAVSDARGRRRLLPKIGGRYFGFDSVSCALLSSSSSSLSSLLSFSILMLNVEPEILLSALMSGSSDLVSAT